MRARCCRRSMSRACRRRRRSISMIDREKAGALRRHLRGHQQHDLDQSRLELHQRLPEPRPHAARRRAGRRADRMQTEDILNYNVKNSRGQLVPFSSFATVEWATRPDADRRLQLLSGGAHLRRRRSPASPRGDAIAEMERLAGKLPRGFGYEWTGQSLQEKLSGSQAPFLLGALGARGVPVSRRALRELDHSARGAADGAARHLRRGGRGDAARPAQRRLFHRRPDHHHRPGGKGRDPDHRVRQGSARAGQAAGGGDASRPAACASARS